MRVLVGKTFGIGNACLAVPMVKALASLGHRVDILVGDGPDDFGAREIFEQLRQHGEFVGSIWTNSVPFNVDGYDVAIMSIPYDGRWQNGLHFFAQTVIDERRRPDNVERLGFDMWKKHEVEYQLDNARGLGWTGTAPDGSFMSPDPDPRGRDDDLIYVGLGYKRDAAGFGASKHFGDARYASLLKEIKRLRPSARFISTGFTADLMAWYMIVRDLQDTSYYQFPMLDLRQSLTRLSRCTAYIGNDTGMMHAAASLGMPTCGLFAYPDLLVKNPPFCERSDGILFTSDGPPIEEIAQRFVDFVWRK